MGKRVKSTHPHGDPVGDIRLKAIVADPHGNREQRRAARRLGVVESPPPPGTPTCPHCGRTSHGFCCAALLGQSEVHGA